MSQPSKRCPACGSVNFIHARVCACGHQFTTRFPGDPQGQPAAHSAHPQPSNFPAAHTPPASHPTIPYGPHAPIAPSYPPQRVVVPGTVMPPYMHSVLLVAIAAALLPPLGAILNKQYAKSAVVLLAFATSLSLHYFGAAIVWAALVIDAIYTAQRHYRGELVRPWDFF